MATIIDALVVTLGLDAKGFKRGSTEARREMQDIKKETRGLSDSFKDLKGAVGEVLVAVGSLYLLKKTVVDVLTLDAGVSRLSKNLDMQPGKIMAWENALKTLGGTAADADQMLMGVTRTQSEMRLKGESGMIPYLRALGVALVDTGGKALPASDVLLQVSDRLQQMSKYQGRSFAYNFAAQMGYGDAQINMLLKGRKAVQGLLAEEERLRPFNEKQARAAERAQHAWQNLGVAWSGVAQQITDILMPAIQRAMPVIERGLSWIAQNKEVIVAGLAAFGTVITALVVPALWSAVTAAAAFWAEALPIVAIGALLVAFFVELALVVQALKRRWDDWRAGKPDEFFDTWGPSILKVVDAWNAVAGAIGKATDALGKWYDKHLKKTVESTWKSIKQGAVYIYEKGVEGLKNLIASGEGNYDSVNLGARGGYRASTRPLESMTINEILAAQARKEFMAAGRYQMMPDTIKEAKASMGLSGNERFDAAMQDKMLTQYILGSKRKALRDYLTGQSSDKWAAVLDLAKEFASIADPRTGKSYYAGQGNNRASISAADAARVLQSVREQQIHNIQNNTRRTSSIENNVNVNVSSAGQDGHSIGRDIAREMLFHGFIFQADTGLV